MSCSTSDTTLVEAVRRHDVLWRPQDSNYFNRNKKKLAWEEVAKTTGRSVQDAKSKWKSLRDYHLRKRRQLPSGSGCPPPENSSWQKEMSFLDDAIKPKPVTTNLTQPGTGSQSLFYYTNQYSNELCVSDEDSSETQLPDDSAASCASGVLPAATLLGTPRVSAVPPAASCVAGPSHPRSSGTNGQVKQVRGPGARGAEKLDAAIASIERAVSDLRNPDLLFGQLVGLEMERVRDDKKADARLEILTVLKRAQSD
ncbi:uncharacterized protein LOC122385893 isoform X2 [Amphibalanus amphitrite]|uniref:uncharacterized protein LOC122378855 isoform X2 n=1 Tax=Amphibalanus amphitrite TaxID=1232801 RepID=UPI001C8FC652|nr:uncharacterized protein LOC122378855 isoform X2 [Amphibalanus amphitrite]XP_043230449.1 uncharacterized protein LOC122385893 isoform X2 [Amphibalanus amphitrite]